MREVLSTGLLGDQFDPDHSTRSPPKLVKADLILLGAESVYANLGCDAGSRVGVGLGV